MTEENLTIRISSCGFCLVSRRAKGADTWRLVRRCCAERASGYAPATLRPQNLWAFLCRAIRWGDVECTKAIARQIQAERGGDASRGILRCVGCEDDAALGGLGLLGSVGAENQNYSALHWLGNCDDGNFDDPTLHKASLLDTAPSSPGFAVFVARRRSKSR